MARDGTLAYVRGAQSGMRQLVWFDREAGEQGALAEAVPGVTDKLGSVSPDGRFVLADVSDAESHDIWVFDVERGTRTRFTFGDELGTHAEWFPDGKSIYYSVGPTYNATKIFRKSADGTGDAVEITEGIMPAFSPDGRWMIYTRWGGDTSWDLWMLDLETEGAEPEVFLQSPELDAVAVVSPDGRYVAYSSAESGKYLVYMRPFPHGAGRWQISTGDGNWPRWSADGKELFYIEDSARLLSVSVDTTGSPRVGRPELIYEARRYGYDLVGYRGYDVAPDGRLLVTKHVGDDAESASIVLVDNWLSEFE